MRGRIYNSPPKVKKIKPNYLTTFQDFYVEKVLEKYPYLTNIKSACHELEIKNLL